jgi:ATPase subunit of ABC transporter with duplicated ATPase domains
VRRSCIVGRNGVGKTTLLKALLADAPGVDPTGARHRRRARALGPRGVGRLLLAGPHGRHREGHDGRGVAPQLRARRARQDIHGLLGQMLFSGEEGHKPTAALSGGETARLLFCRIMLQKPNVLVLDEPTNHLDLESINALNVALQKFEGTVFLVTHDEDLLEEVGTRVWHCTRDGIEDWKGTYEEYTAAVGV